MPLDNIPAAPRYAEEIAILDRMRELLATPEGWCQGFLQKRGAMCLYGVINTISHGHSDWEFVAKDRVLTRMPFSPVLAAVETKLKSFVSGGDLVTFNNAPTTTHPDILALIDKARAEFVRAGQIEAIMDYGERRVAELVGGI